MPGGCLSDPTPRRIYLLDPKRYSPETIAVAFAKTSRSPLPFDAIADDLNAEKSAEFNEKWVVGYGHASVAEHAVLHLAIENVSRLAVETIEGNRLASFTEKSTRYQKWPLQAFFSPPELKNHPLVQDYQDTCAKLFGFYIDCQPQLQAQLMRVRSRLEGESKSTYERCMHSQALDAARYLLPAASLANLGMTANARTLEHAISKMLSSQLEEVRLIGESIKMTACTSVPTLIKYAAGNEYQRSLANWDCSEVAQPSDNTGSDWLTLVNYNSLGLEKLLASMFFRHGNQDYENSFKRVSNLSDEEKRKLLERALEGMGEHDNPAHEFEHTAYTFDILMDQGAFYEVKRHRMMTQSPQSLGASLGYATPRIFSECGLLKRYQETMDRAAACWVKLAEWNPSVASYVVPNGFYRRVLLSMNVREAYTFIKLRSSPNAHFAVRRIACRMAEEIQRAHPLIGGLLLQNSTESSDSINKAYFF
jgi:thymidylate synthase ThyX